MLLGFAMAQALPLLASPLLARLFSPEAFGLQTLFVSWATVLGVLGTLRLDLAVVLAETRREALQIVSLAALQAAAIVSIIMAVAALLGSRIASAVGHTELVGWIWGLAPMVVALAIVQTAGGFLTWSKTFGPTSQAQVLNQAVYLVTAISLGFAFAPIEGLVAAKVIGNIAAAGLLLLAIRGTLPELQLPSRADFPALWRRCRPFLMFNTPYSLIGAVGREVPIFAFSAVGATATAGFYGLARTLLGAPATLLAASLSQVFYREAAEHRGTARLQDLTVGLLNATLRATAPTFAFVMVWGDVGFTLLFGPVWETAGQYAMILAVAAWLGIQTAWPERLYESVGRQGVSFAIQIGFDITTALTVFGTVFAGLPHILAVALFAGINSLFHLGYLTGMFWVAGFSFRRLGLALSGAVLVLAAAIAAMLVIRWLPLPPLWGLLTGGSIAAGSSGLLGLFGYLSIRDVLQRYS